MAIDLLVLSVLLEKTAQNSHPPHPQFLDGHTGVGGTLSLSGAGMTTLSASEGVLARASARVNGLGLLNDQTILDQTTDVLTGVGIGDLVDFIGIHPDLVPPALEDGGGKPFLQAHRAHLRKCIFLPRKFLKTKTLT